MARKDIIQELNDLGSGLPAESPQNRYEVPAGYFEGLASEIMAVIKAEEFLSSLPKKNPYEIPAGYFEGLESRVMNRIREHADYQTSEEEIESLSPLLSSLSKKPVFSVPENYFENLAIDPFKQEAKIVTISVTRTRWFRMAAAAVVAGVILTASLFVFKKEKIDPVKNPQGWVAKNLKKVDKDDLEAFVEIAGSEAEKESAKTDSKSAEIKEVKELMNEVSEKEINAFITETASAYGGNSEDIMMN